MVRPVTFAVLDGPRLDAKQHGYRAYIGRKPSYTRDQFNKVRDMRSPAHRHQLAGTTV